MADIKYVMYSLDFCANKGDCKDCLYDQSGNDSIGCVNKLMIDALELLKEQQAEIERMKAEKRCCKDCEYFGNCHADDDAQDEFL